MFILSNVSAVLMFHIALFSRGLGMESPSEFWGVVNTTPCLSPQRIAPKRVLTRADQLTQLEKKPSCFLSNGSALKKRVRMLSLNRQELKTFADLLFENGIGRVLTKRESVDVHSSKADRREDVL